VALGADVCRTHCPVLEEPENWAFDGKPTEMSDEVTAPTTRKREDWHATIRDIAIEDAEAGEPAAMTAVTLDDRAGSAWEKNTA